VPDKPHHRILEDQTLKQPHRRKCVVPDFQDQVAATGFLQQPDRGVGVYFDNPRRIRLSADTGKHVHGGDAEPERSRGLSSPVASAASDGGASSTIVPPALRFMRPGISQRSPLGSTMSSEASGVAETGEKTAPAQTLHCARSTDRQSTARHRLTPTADIFWRNTRARRRAGKSRYSFSCGNRLDQYRIVILRNLVQISGKQRLAANDFLQNLPRETQVAVLAKAVPPSSLKYAKSVFALVPRGAGGCDAVHAGRNIRRQASQRRHPPGSGW